MHSLAGERLPGGVPTERAKGAFSYMAYDTTQCTVGAAISGCDSGSRSSWRARLCGPLAKGWTRYGATDPPVVVIVPKN